MLCFVYLNCGLLFVYFLLHNLSNIFNLVNSIKNIFQKVNCRQSQVLLKKYMLQWLPVKSRGATLFCVCVYFDVATTRLQHLTRHQPPTYQCSANDARPRSKEGCRAGCEFTMWWHFTAVQNQKIRSQQSKWWFTNLINLHESTALFIDILQALDCNARCMFKFLQSQRGYLTNVL